MDAGKLPVGTPTAATQREASAPALRAEVNARAPARESFAAQFERLQAAPAQRPPASPGSDPAQAATQRPRAAAGREAALRERPGAGDRGYGREQIDDHRAPAKTPKRAAPATDEPRRDEPATTAAPTEDRGTGPERAGSDAEGSARDDTATGAGTDGGQGLPLDGNPAPAMAGAAETRAPVDPTSEPLGVDGAAKTAAAVPMARKPVAADGRPIIAPAIPADTDPPALAATDSAHTDPDSGTIAATSATAATPIEAGAGEFASATVADGAQGQPLASRQDFAAAMVAATPPEAAPGQPAGVAPAPAAPATAMAPSAASAGTAPAPVVPLSTPITDPNWDQALGARVHWLAHQGVHSAELRLNPPELGTLDVRITAAGDSANVQFYAASGAVRDALEAALPRLRELFVQHGLQLDGAGVSDRPPPDRRFGDPAGSQHPGYPAQGAMRGYPDDRSDEGIVGGARLRHAHAGLVDYYI